MRLKDQAKNSMLILNRSSVIAGAVLIAIISIGLGYFIGFKTGKTGAPETEHIVEKPLKLPEEKRVLELPQPKQPEGQQPPVQLAQINPQDTSQGNKHQENYQRTEQIEDKANEETSKGGSDKKRPNYWWVDKKGSVEIQKTGRADQKSREDYEQGFNKQIGQAGPTQKELSQIERDKAKRPEPPAQPDEGAARKQKPETLTPEKLPAPKEEKKSIKPPVKPQPQQKLYAIQFGAFPNRQGAEELKAQLKAKGINAYIVEKAKDDIYFRVRVGSYQGRKDAEKNAISIEKQTGLKGFVTAK